MAKHDFHLEIICGKTFAGDPAAFITLSLSLSSFATPVDWPRSFCTVRKPAKSGPAKQGSQHKQALRLGFRFWCFSLSGRIDATGGP